MRTKGFRFFMPVTALLCKDLNACPTDFKAEPNRILSKSPIAISFLIVIYY